MNFGHHCHRVDKLPANKVSRKTNSNCGWRIYTSCFALTSCPNTLEPILSPERAMVLYEMLCTTFRFQNRLEVTTEFCCASEATPIDSNLACEGLCCICARTIHTGTTEHTIKNLQADRTEGNKHVDFIALFETQRTGRRDTAG